MNATYNCMATEWKTNRIQVWKCLLKIRGITKTGWHMIDLYPQWSILIGHVMMKLFLEYTMLGNNPSGKHDKNRIIPIRHLNYIIPTPWTSILHLWIAYQLANMQCCQSAANIGQTWLNIRPISLVIKAWNPLPSVCRWSYTNYGMGCGWWHELPLQWNAWMWIYPMEHAMAGI